MKSSTEEFINKCKEKFGDSFAYDNTSYTTSHGYVCITCPKHGDFMTIATNFLSRGRCPKCNKEEILGLNALKYNFIKKAKNLYGDLYSYDKVKYTKAKGRIEITCKTHGAFYVSPDKFLQGQICPKCAEAKKEKTKTDNFILQAKKIYGDKYQYNKTLYVNNKTKITITCPLHGDFVITPKSFLNGNECKTCSFIMKANDIHGFKYDYSKVCYCNQYSHATITCPKHGDFIMSPMMHLKGRGCYKCSMEENMLLPFIIKANKVHNYSYDYSKVNKIKYDEKVIISCPKHGDFKQLPNNHLNGKGCPKCSRRNKTIKELVEEFRNVHGNKYDYSNVKYSRSRDKVAITCPIHGKFLQSPNKHLNGRGCPICKQSHLEESVRNKLDSLSIQFEQEKRIGKQRLDFFIPSLKIAIECQGEQHFINAFSFGGTMMENTLGNAINLDRKKNKYCIDNGIKLFYIFSSRIDPSKILSDCRFKGLYCKENIISFDDIEKLVK